MLRLLAFALAALLAFVGHAHVALLFIVGVLAVGLACLTFAEGSLLNRGSGA